MKPLAPTSIGYTYIDQSLSASCCIPTWYFSSLTECHFSILISIGTVISRIMQIFLCIEKITQSGLRSVEHIQNGKTNSFKSRWNSGRSESIFQSLASCKIPTIGSFLFGLIALLEDVTNLMVLLSERKDMRPCCKDLIGPLSFKELRRNGQFLMWLLAVFLSICAEERSSRIEVATILARLFTVLGRAFTTFSCEIRLSSKTVRTQLCL